MRAIISSYVAIEAHQITLLLFFFSLCLLHSINIVEATVHHLKWEIKYEYRSPDCFKKLGITINGLSPGPTITATQGDTLVVQITNSLITENTAIHWHGIRQRGTPWSDGSQGITQCPIQPGETFIYRFVVDRAGTYIYHAHYGMQRSAGLHGLIRVLVPEGTKEPYSYDEDRSIILNDWWHKSTMEQSTGLLSLNFGWVGEPQSLLINGRGRYNCSLAGTSDVCNMTNPECSPSVLTMVSGKTYLFRIASVTSLSALNLEIEGHNMTIVESDSHYVNPVTVKNLNIYSGETYSVIVKANQDPSRNYWIALNVVSRKPATPTGTAILNYYPNHPLNPPPTSPPLGPLWNDTLYRFNQSKSIKSHPNYIETPPRTSDRLILLLNTQNKINGYTRWSVNNVSFIFPTTPYLIAIKDKLRQVFSQTPAPDTYDYKNYDIYSVSENPNAMLGDSIHRLEFNSTVDIILQNANTLSNNTSETHPWHLHGHDFWVLGYGLGKFDPRFDLKSYNLVDPIQKNTVAVYPYGWTALRLRSDNPGVWAFHCHLEAHFFIGMGIVLEEGVEKLGKLPKAIMGCGQSKSLGGS
ncbi:L-ascorbate oxidase [Phalaenopsis equestris]|uniref:L-ascorbate oxidase n=1 Tax=Phalaenopsis equestris TaxID=78828 RepID=UPI0009E55A21|nr:L-ascorbate oxidase [Phalaenopsis equestris]